MPVPAWLSLAVLVGLAVVLVWGTHRLLRRRARGLRYLATAGVPALILLAAAVWMTAREQATAPAPPRSAADTSAAIGALTPKNGTPSRGIRPASPSGFDPAAFVRAQLAALVPGHIVFNPPETMREGRSERITVRIARADAESAIKSGLQGRGVPQVESIEVGTFMRVRLFGDGFRVTARGDENQAVPETGFAEWLFDVLPEAGGTRELTLAVAVRFKLPGSDEVTDLPVLTRSIAVQVDEWWRAKEIFAANWQWFLGGIGSVLVGLVGFFGKRWLGAA